MTKKKKEKTTVDIEDQQNLLGFILMPSPSLPFLVSQGTISNVPTCPPSVSPVSEPWELKIG